MKSWLRLGLPLVGIVVVASAIGFLWAMRGRTPAGPPEETPPSQTRHVELDPAKQQRIWEAEHITFELEQRFGKAFMKALLAKDRHRLQHYLRLRFSATVLGHATPAVRQHSGVTEWRWDRRSTPDQPVSPDGWTKALLQPVNQFARVERSRLRVLKIEPLDDSNLRWKAKLLLSLVGADRDGRPVSFASEHRIECTILEETDIDRTPILDRWVVESEVRRRSTRKLMTEVTKESGLADLPIPDNWNLPADERLQVRFQMAVADFDRDGFLDIAVAVLGEAPLLLRSTEGRRFDNVADSVGLGSDPLHEHLAGWIDFDNDGFPDLLLGDRLYHNEGGRAFTDVTAASQLRIDPDCLGCAVADYDGDGWLDLYLIYQDEPGTADDDPRPWVNDDLSGKENRLWRNLGGGKFRDVTEEAKAGGGPRNTHAVAWYFYDDDHWPDLYLANDFGRNVILRNRGDGTFEDVSDHTGAADYATSMGVATGDFDNDGGSDVYVANMYSKMGRRIIGHVTASDYPPGIFTQIQGSCAGNRLYRRLTSSGRYEDVSVAMGVYPVGWAYAPAMADLDGDGWLDLYATSGFMSFDRTKPDG